MIGESLDSGTLNSTSLENCSSTIEVTFMTESSFTETEQKVGKKRVKLQNEKGDEIT
jgi:hypothetical protein